MPVEERELRSMTSDMADAHHGSLPSMRASLDAWRESNADIESGISELVATPTSRRLFLLGGGALLGGAALVGTGATGLASAAARTGSAGVFSAAMGGQNLTGDLAVVGLAAALENLAVATYQAGIDAATAGKLGAVPPAVVTFAMTAQSQHKDHAAAWNGVLTGAGKKAVTGVDLTVKKSVDQAFGSVTDVPGLAMLALDLENAASATYLAAIDAVKSKPGIQTAATIQPVELQHAATLLFVLGEYPVPNTFAKQDGARTTSDKIGAA
ncbi:MAG: ferritin-like domain-containing protein [Acidimicrobiia bacterium]